MSSIFFPCHISTWAIACIWLHGSILLILISFNIVNINAWSHFVAILFDVGLIDWLINSLIARSLGI